MSVSFRPRRVVAALLTFLLIGSVPPSAASAAEDRKPPESTGSVKAHAPWWVDWLRAFDLNGNRIDDRAEEVAQARIDNGKPDALVPVLVSFARSPVDVDRLIERVGAASDAYAFKTQPLVDLNVPARNLARLETVPGVVAVEHDRRLHPVLDVGARAIQAHNGQEPNTFYNGRTAEDLGYTGEDMVVAVLDTGVQDQHSAFDGKWIAGANVSTVVPLHCVNTPDDDGHGTHVASTVLGQMPGDDLFGTAKAAKLVEVKISLGPASFGGINRGFEFVKLYNDALEAGDPMCGPDDDHIDVATLSFGSTGRGGPNAGSTEGFIDALVETGVAVTIAVGNCGPQASATCSFSDDDNGISSPGNAAGAIGVASFNDRDTVDRANDAISGFSSRGPNSGGGDTAAGGATDASNLKDRYRKPDVAAPGQSIQAAGPVPFTLSTSSGTSMATPHVAGVAALLLQAGEEVKGQTGDVNLMASTTNGFTSDNDYSFGDYPVRDALAHATDYKEAGAKALWTGPNSRGVKWNNAWGYGQVNAFDALCWAWANVLDPGGATPPAPVEQNCDLTTDPDPDPTPTESPTPEPSPTPASGPGATYFFHSSNRVQSVDLLTEEATYDETSPAGSDTAIAADIPGVGNGAPQAIWDPSWTGTVAGTINSLTVDFWQKNSNEPLGEVHYRVSVWVGDPLSVDSVEHDLPQLVQEVQPGSDPVRITHTFTTTADGNPLNIHPQDEPVTINISGWFTVNEAMTVVLYDSEEFASGFSINGGAGEPSPELEQTTVTFTERSEASGQHSDETLFEAQLKDSDGDPAPGAELTFALGAEESSRTFTAITDESGIGSVTPTLTEKPADYPLAVRFDGDESHEGSADSTAFVVDKEDTALELTVKGEDDDKRVEARLSDLDSPNNGVSGRTIDLYSDSELIGSGQTDGDGIATVALPPQHRGANRTYETVFEGDDFYLDSSDDRPGRGGGGGGPQARQTYPGGLFVL